MCQKYVRCIVKKQKIEGTSSPEFLERPLVEDYWFKIGFDEFLSSL